MTRISRHTMYMEIARVVSRRGTCPRLCVGAVVVINNRVVSIGYNGSEPGKPHCTDEGCILKNGACIRTIHAEVNALNHVPDGAITRNTTLYLTHSPCQLCAEFIAKPEQRVTHLFFESLYRDTNPIRYLVERGVYVYQLMPSGYIVNPLDGNLVEIS